MRSQTPLSNFTCFHLEVNRERQMGAHGEKCWASLVAQTLKSLPAVQETRIRSLGQEDALEKERATHSSILAWRIPWTEEPAGLQSIESQRVGHD